MTTTPSKDTSNKNSTSKSTSAAKSTAPAKTTKKVSSGASPVNSSNIGLWLIGASIVIVAIVVGIIIFNENQARTRRLRSRTYLQHGSTAMWLAARTPKL